MGKESLYHTGLSRRDLLQRLYLPQGHEQKIVLPAGEKVRAFDIDPHFEELYIILGGQSLIGRLISPGFDRESDRFQAGQHLILQKNLNTGTMGMYPLLDEFSRWDPSNDNVLYGLGVPKIAAAELRDGKAESLLQDKDIKSYWEEAPFRINQKNLSPQQIFGLATSYPERRGAVLVQRFQNTVIFKWVEDVPGGKKPGTVEMGNIGKLARDSRFISPEVLQQVPGSMKPEEGKTAFGQSENKIEKVKVPRKFGKVEGLTIPLFFFTDDDLANLEKVKTTLKIYKDKGIKATLFPIGIYLDRYWDFLVDAMKDGFEVGNHTMNHATLTTRNLTEIKKEIMGPIEVVKRHSLPDSAVKNCKVDRLFRPPHWETDDEVNQALAEIDSELGHTPDQEMKIVMQSTGTGGTDFEDTGKPRNYKQADVRQHMIDTWFTEDWILTKGNIPDKKDYGKIGGLHTINADNSIRAELIDEMRKRGFDLTHTIGEVIK